MSASSKSNPTPAQHWERGWEEHEQMRLQRLADLPLVEKLIWLKQGPRLAMQLGALQPPRTDDPSSTT
jgi:hypothetical protein